MSEDQPPGSPGQKLRAERTKSLASHTTSVPLLEVEPHQPSATLLSRGTSLRIREKSHKTPQDDGGGNRGSWSFGSVAKVVGSFGTGVVQGTKAVGSGVVQGTKAVGTGVVQGTKAVGTGVVTTTKVVGTGVVQGSIAVGTGVVEGGKAAGRVTVAAGKGVITAGECVGSAAVAGATAVGTATKDVGHAVASTTTSAVTDTSNWVKSQSESLGHEFASTHTLLPDQTLADVANEHGCSIQNIICINHVLSRRHLRPGKELLIPFSEVFSTTPHPLETFVVKANLICCQSGQGNVGKEMLRGMNTLFTDGGQLRVDSAKEGMLNFSLKDVVFQPIPQSTGGRSPSRHHVQMKSSPSMSSNSSTFSTDPIVTISMGQITRIWAEFSANLYTKDRVPELLPAGSARAIKNKNDFRVKTGGSENKTEGGMRSSKNGCDDSPPLRSISAIEGGGSPPTECVVVELDMEKKLEELNNQELLENQQQTQSECVYITIATAATSPRASRNESRGSMSPRGSRNESESTTDTNVFNEEDEYSYGTTSPTSVADGAMETPCLARYLFEVAKSDSVNLMAYLDLWYHEILNVELELNQFLDEHTESDVPYETDGPSLLDASQFLTEQMEMDIHLQLPATVQSQHWSLAYSTEKNGFSLQNMYRAVAEDQEPFLIAVLDNCGHVFGAFLTCVPQQCENFIGTGNSWLFAYDDQEGEHRKINIFHWSGKNEYFFRGTSDNIIIGAADGKFGILIDGDLHKGRIQECSTFNRWPLREEDFTINCLECWKFL